MEICSVESRAQRPTKIIYDFAQPIQSSSNDEMINNNTISKKKLSRSEILKLAEERLKIAGTIKRSPDNFSHKRIAISEDVTRDQAPGSELIVPNQLGTTSPSVQLNDEEFFENLLKKMTAEQFIPLDQMDGSKKRTCLWNKENLSNSKKRKRRRETVNAVCIPPKILSIKERLLPRQGVSNSLAQVETRSHRKGFDMLKQARSTPWKNSVLDLIQEDINMEESDRNFADYGSMTTEKKSFNQSFNSNWIIDNFTSNSSCETIRLRHDCAMDRLNQGPDRPVISYDYYRKPYLVAGNFSNSPCLPTIEEGHEPSVIIPSLVYDPVDTEFERFSNVSLNFTPPSPPKLGDCNTDNFYAERGDSVIWNSSPTLTYSNSDLNNTSSCVRKIF